jgi:hypothetical protein
MSKSIESSPINRFAPAAREFGVPCGTAQFVLPDRQAQVRVGTREVQDRADEAGVDMAQVGGTGLHRRDRESATGEIPYLWPATKLRCHSPSSRTIGSPHRICPPSFASQFHLPEPRRLSYQRDPCWWPSCGSGVSLPDDSAGRASSLFAGLGCSRSAAVWTAR